MPAPISAQAVKTTLASLGLNPSRRLGQNFLVDPAVRDRGILLAAIQPHETVLEIGPGLGALTEALAQHARRVIAVEKDRVLASYLVEQFAQSDNVEIVWADIRRVDIGKALGLSRRAALKGGAAATWTVVASPPYYLVPFLIRTLLDQPSPPRQTTLVVQREVADRLTAGVGEMNLLALMAQLKSRVAKHDRISRRAFWPQPEVDSAIVTLASHAPDSRPIPAAQEEEFFSLVRPLFQTRRKQLAGSLGRATKLAPTQVLEILAAAHIPPESRPQDISVDKWVGLFRIIEPHRI